MSNNMDKDDEKKHGKSTNPGLTEIEATIIQAMKQSNLQAQQERATANRAMLQAGGTSEEEKKKQEAEKHAFWDTQPMPHTGRTDLPEGPIVPDKTKEELRQDPYTMPKGFEWTDVDITVESQRLELYNLLANNYVEDDDALFRFDYSQEFLLWAMTPPGFRCDFLVGVRSSSNQKLVAFISAIPTELQAHERKINVVEINFLCVHKKLRSKRLAPVLIKEITRRVNLSGVFQAVYTAGQVLPVPVASARYFHRSLNPKKLVRIEFSRLGERMTMARMLKLYKLPAESQTPGLRPMEERHVDGVHELLNTYLTRFAIKVLFTKEEIRHWLLPRDKVIYSYVVESPDGKVTDFLSFYHLPSSVLAHNETLHAAYSFYNVANTLPLEELMRDALILAKQEAECDVFNALNLMENGTFLDELKFGAGDGNLQYYIYNWSCPEVKPDKVGIVLL